MERHKTAVLAIWATAVVGCGTFGDAICGPADGHVYYRGVRMDLEAIKEGGAHSLLAADIPFSAVADTLLVPYTACIDIIPPQSQTQTTLLFTYSRIEDFWNQHGRVPARADELPDVKDKDCAMKDGWRRDLHWASDATAKVTVWSLRSCFKSQELLL